MSQVAGMPEICPANCALPCTLSERGAVSRTVGDAEPGLQTRVPVMEVTRPGVPLEVPPFNTRPSTVKKVLPVVRFTYTWPLWTDQGPAPEWMAPTWLSTPGAVITPTMLFHRTMESSRSNANAVATQNVSVNNTATTFFIFPNPFLNRTPALARRPARYFATVEEHKLARRHAAKL